MSHRLLTIFAATVLLNVYASAQTSNLTTTVSEDDESVTGTISGSQGSVSITLPKNKNSGSSSRNPATGKETGPVQEPPSSFAGVSLGMTLEEVKSALQKDQRFGYRGDRDVSLMPGKEKVLIETDAARYSPSPYLDRCWFQFHDGKLYVMTINLNQDKLDHYSVFSSLCEKYGEPTTLTPQKSEWVSDSVIVDLERPLAIKYTDRAVMTSLIDAASVQDTAAEMNRAQFLEGL